MKKKIFNLIILVGLSFGLMSCATTPEGHVAQAPAYGQASQLAAYGFTYWALNLSHGDAKDLADKKDILRDVVKYLTIARDQGMTGAQVASGLLDQVPAKEHWRIWVNNIKLSLAYATGPEAKAIISGLIAGIDSAVAAFP